MFDGFKEKEASKKKLEEKRKSQETITEFNS